MLSQEDFYERAKDFALLKDVEGKYFTFEEYKTLIKDNQTDKDGNLVYLYANNKEEQYSYIEAAKQKGYSVLLMEGQLDTPMVNMLEQKLEKSRFTRVDADIIDRLIVKEDAKKTDLSKEQSDNLTEVFRSQMPQLDKAEFFVEIRYAAGNKVVHQLIDLALLQNNMLKGEALTNFVKRSVEMI